MEKISLMERNEWKNYMTILGFTPEIVVKDWLNHPLTGAPKLAPVLFGPKKISSSKPQ
jgi:hypothetical protein